MSEWDAIVVGGGIAGSAAATWRAKSGKRVLLLEKEQAAHHKVCGEFLSHEVLHYLEQLGVDPLALGAVPIHRLELIRGRRIVSAPLPFRGMSLSRYVLDEALIQRAATAGADVRRGVTVSALTANSSDWEVTAGDARFTGKDLFLATGKRDLASLPRAHGRRNDFIGFKMHYQLTPQASALLAGNVRIILFRGGYAGLELIEGGAANLCLVVKKSRFIALGKQWENLLAAITAETPALAETLIDAWPLWEKPLAIFGIPYGFIHRGPTPANLYRLGDQMAVIPSFSGDGMAIALHTAALATRAADAPSYHHQARAELSSPMRWASLVSLGTTSPLLGAPAFLWPSVLPSIASATRLKKPLSAMQ